MSNSVFTKSGATFDRDRFGAHLSLRLASTNRDSFLIDNDDWVYWRENSTPIGADGAPVPEQKLVSRAALKLLLDYCESDWSDMTIIQYAAAVFHSREPAEGETLFDLLPDVRKRASAERLGFGHIYGR